MMKMGTTFLRVYGCLLTGPLPTGTFCPQKILWGRMFARNTNKIRCVIFLGVLLHYKESNISCAGFKGVFWL